MEVTLGDEAHALARGVLPFARILARVGAARPQRRVGDLGAAASMRTIAAHEYDDRRRLRAIAVAAGVKRPAREEVLVALELARRRFVANAIVELGDHVDPLLAARDLDDDVGADRLEPLDLKPLARSVGCEEVVRGAPAG